jgi:hypothetical protein
VKDLCEGKGSETWAEGIGSYTGEYKAGKRDGFGKAVLRNGKIYEGTFQDGKMHGHGVYQTKTTTYAGDFQNNRQHG